MRQCAFGNRVLDCPSAANLRLFNGLFGVVWLGEMKVPRVSKLVCVIALVCLVIGCEDGPKAHDPKITPVESASGPFPPKGPDEYWVKFDTTRGDVIVEVHRAWSPYGADRFYELVKSGFYDECKFFRVAGFVVQFGISGDPQVSAKWHDANIPDDKFDWKDKNRKTNNRGYVSFAKSQMPNSRTTQIFINCVDNGRLDEMGFTPFGVVISGMTAIDALYSKYAEEPTNSQDRIEKEGDAYLTAAFPKLDSIKKATLLPGKPDVPNQPEQSKKPDESKKSGEPKPSASPPAPQKDDAAKKAG
jgi:peptidyl-prolyl cis-trans isomerase A (cyclophilin A)